MDETTPPQKRFSAILLTVLLFVLLVAAFAGYKRWFMTQRDANQQVVDHVDMLEARLQNLEKGTVRHEERIRSLEESVEKLQNVPPPAAITTAPANSPPALEATAGTPAPAAEEGRIAALEKQIAELKAASPMQSPENIRQAIELLSTFHRFSDKVLSGRPFAAELTAFEDLAKPEESSGSPVAVLAPYAESGIPTFATLLSSFDQASDNLNGQLAIAPSGAGFWERFKYNISHLVSVRRIDDAQEGDSVTAIVGRAQAHLEREEIEAAMAEIKSLPETARGNFASWLDDAQLVTEAPSLIDQLEEQIMQKAFHTEAPPAALQPPAPPAPPAAEPGKTPQPAPTPQPPKP